MKWFQFHRLVLLSGYCFVAFELSAQNLVPNAGFEQLSGCPLGSGEITLAPPWSSAGSPADLFNACHVNTLPFNCTNVSVPLNFAGNALARAGSSYAGFYTRRNNPDERTYLTVPLATPMNTGQLYRVSAFFRKSSVCDIATNNIGMIFSTAALVQPGNGIINLLPPIEITSILSDTTTWVPLTAFYIATGGEAYLNIGNFRNDAVTIFNTYSLPAPTCSGMLNAAYYFVDDISVSLLTEQLNITGDSVVCTGESTMLTGITNTSGWWSTLSAPQDTIPSINNTITVAPLSTSTYLWHGLLSTISVTVMVISPPVFSTLPDTMVCEGEFVIYDITVPGCTYAWSNGATSSTISLSDGGTYIVTVSNAGCSVRDTFILNVIPAPVPTLPSMATFCSELGETLLLDAGSGLSYYWNPTGDTSASIQVEQPGIYSVTVSHAGGCTQSATVEITEQCLATIFVPGAFSPNGDGKNDLFYAEGSGLKDFNMWVFNRWGQPLFETREFGIAGGWNGSFQGKPAPAGVYVFRLSYTNNEGTGRKMKISRNGSFYLIR